MAIAFFEYQLMNTGMETCMCAKPTPLLDYTKNNKKETALNQIRNADNKKKESLPSHSKGP